MMTAFPQTPACVDIRGRIDHVRLLAVGTFLLLGSIALRLIGERLEPAAAADPRTVALLIAVLSSMGFALLYLLVVIPRLSSRPRLVAAVVLMGLVMRLAHWGVTPAYEDDYLRYLWDGAVVAAGLDPYEAPPAAIKLQRLLRSVHSGPATAAQSQAWALADLADTAPDSVLSPSYRYLTTIYPPLTQAAFALAHWVAPYSLDAWRAVLLCAELLGMAMLLRLLVEIGASPLWAALYWWNPIVIGQIAHAAHMDALLVPVLLMALGAIARRQSHRAAAFIAAAAAIKLWPLLLLPSVLSASVQPMRNLRALGLGVLLSSALLWPQLRHLDSADTGLQAFATEWVRNAFAFPWVVEGMHWAGGAADTVARVVVAIVVAGCFSGLAFAGPAGVERWAQRWAMCIAALFLLAPTGYPWYFVWFAPLLCFSRSVPLLLLVALLPLYYGLFVVDAREDRASTEPVLLAVQFLPVWLALAWSLARRWVRRRSEAYA